VPKALAQPDWYATPRFRLIAGAALIVILTCAIYFPSLRGGFLLDDDILLTKNNLVHASDGLPRIWFSTEPTDYWPLFNSAFWFEWRFWNINPTGYRAVSLAIHILNVFLLWAVLKRLRIPGAYLAALLFAVHPVNVEAVAWISQLKTVLAMSFFLLSIWFYLKSEDDAFDGWYWLSLFVFLLAILSKGSVVILPALLLLISWWRKNYISRYDLARSIPFFLLAIAGAAANVWFQKHGESIVIRDVTWDQRIAGAGGAVWFYLGKALAPIDLIFVYPQWNIQTNQLRWWIPTAAAVLVTVALFWQRNSRFGRPLMMAWSFFCIALIPALGFTDVGFMRYSFVTDHYQYLALIGVAAMASAALTVWSRTIGSMHFAALACSALIIGALAVLTLRQTALYIDEEHLYEDTLTKNPDCWLMHFNLGIALRENNKFPKAMEQFQEAMKFKDGSIESCKTYSSVGETLSHMGRTEDAIKQFKQALLYCPTDFKTLHNIGKMLLDVGRPQEALDYLQAAVKEQPSSTEDLINLANALDSCGRSPEAVAKYRQALQIDLDFADAHFNLALTLAKMGNLPEAILHYRQVVRLKPNDLDAWVNLANVEAESNQLTEAIAAGEKALALANAQKRQEAVTKIKSWLEIQRANLSNAENQVPKPVP
jgi:protein O-mannosyl-transferase